MQLNENVGLGIAKENKMKELKKLTERVDQIQNSKDPIVTKYQNIIGALAELKEALERPEKEAKAKQVEADRKKARKEEIARREAQDGQKA